MKEFDIRSERGRAVILAAVALISCAVVITAAVVKNQPKGELIMPSSRAFQQGDELVTDGGIHIVLGDDILSDADAVISRPEEALNGTVWLVNINTAGVDGLMLLPGIGRTRAEAIIEYRELNGGFRSVEELLEVKGIGEGIYADMCDYCLLEGPSVQLIEE